MSKCQDEFEEGAAAMEAVQAEHDKTEASAKKEHNQAQASVLCLTACALGHLYDVCPLAVQGTPQPGLNHSAALCVLKQLPLPEANCCTALDKPATSLGCSSYSACWTTY